MSNSTNQDPPAYYDCHVFVCTNERVEGHPRGSCSRRGSIELRNFMKARAKEMGLERVRINTAGCLDRCELGPTMVIYPEGVWYRCEGQEDMEAILRQHIRDGGRAKHLLLNPEDDS